MADVTVVAETRNELGDGPLWLAETEQILWVDILQGSVFQCDATTGAVTSSTLGMSIGCIAARQWGGFLVATQRGIATWQPGDAPTWVVDPEADLSDNRFNDGKVDSHGRFWAGTVSDGADKEVVPHGSLYRLDPDGTVQRMDTGFFVSNGMGWSADDRTMYFSDSFRRTIYAYDFHAASGQIANRRTFVTLPEGGGLPDGLAVDAEGYIWSACWGASRIVRYDPNGHVEREIALPVSHPTSCAFGGAEGTTLYITSAWIAVPPEQRAAQPLAGDIFSIQAPVPGVIVPPFGAA